MAETRSAGGVRRVATDRAELAQVSASSPGAIAHVVRDYGGLTEPFIEQRIRAAGRRSVLWTERQVRPHAGRSRTVRIPAIAPTSIGDRIFHRFPTYGSWFAGAYAMAEMLDRPSVIHAHYLTTGFLVGGRTTTPLVVSAYGFDVSLIPRRPMWVAALRRLASRANRVLVEGPHMRETVIALGFARDSVEIVPISVDLDAVDYQEPRYDGGPLRLLSAGRFVEKKGHDTAIRSFAEALPLLPLGSTLRIVGNGPLQEPLRRLVTTLGLITRVEFLGVLERTDYLRELSQSDILIASSRTARSGDSEGGAPTTILDAQATGVIVVGSDHADIPFLVDDGVTGFVAADSTPSGMAVALRRSLSAVDRWPSIAAAARHQVCTRHSSAALATRLEAIHAQVAA